MSDTVPCADLVVRGVTVQLSVEELSTLAAAFDGVVRRQDGCFQQRLKGRKR